MTEKDSLTPEELPIALLRIAAWQASEAAELACPRCSWEGLFMIDRSSLPRGDTYRLTCANCDLDTTIELTASP